jgi:hypothetical protein
MSIMSKLDLLAKEIFGEFGFNTLTEYQQNLILKLHDLDSIKDYTDLSILK